MFFIFFVQLAEYCKTNLFLPARVRASTKNGRLRLSEGVLAQLPGEMRANVLKRGFLRIISDCAVNPVAAISSFARDGEIGWTVRDGLG